MPINKFGIEYILEIQNGKKSDGILCCERIFVRVHEDGGGPFLSLKTDNLEATDEYDNHTVTISRQDIAVLMTALETILSEHGA